jgi:hypothetical protein
MQIPSDPNDWNFDTVLYLIEHHDGEPDWFDFKAGLEAPSVDKTACAMANTDGGFIIFGVEDAGRHTDSSPSGLIAGVKRDPEFRKKLGDRLGGIVPVPHYELAGEFIQHQRYQERVVPVLYVPRSGERPHMLRALNGFYRRGQGGSAVPMEYQQIRDQMVLTRERAQKLKQMRLAIAQFKWLGDHLQGSGLARVRDRFDTDFLRELWMDVCAAIPAESPLTHDVPEIIQHAGVTNRFLNEAAALPGPSQPGFDVSISGNAWAVRSSCERAEMELQRAFGPV